MFIDFLIELGTTAIVVAALLFTCAVLWDARPPTDPGVGRRATRPR